MNLHRVAVYVGAVLIAIWILFPIAWTIDTSLQTESDLHTVPPYYIPPNPTLKNFWFIFHVEEAMRERLETGPFFLPSKAGALPRSIQNSLIVAAITTILNLLLAGTAAHAFHRIKFRGSYALYLCTIFTRLIPGIAVIVPFFVIVKGLGLFDNLMSLILIYSAFTLPISIWILYSYFEGIPVDIEDAARVDGYSRLEVFFKVVVPVIKPGLVAISLFSFMLSYNEFFYAFILTQTDASHTIPVIIAAIGGNPVMPKGILAAAGIIAALPALIVVTLFRRYIMKGLVAGAIK